MPPAVIHPKDHPATADRRRLAAVALLVALQRAAAGLLIWSEADLAIARPSLRPSACNETVIARPRPF
ncbi:MAG: hypothetical protein ACXU89_09180 [Xanthobacteraceae bacterium]